MVVYYYEYSASNQHCDGIIIVITNTVQLDGCPAYHDCKSDNRIK